MCALRAHIKLSIFRNIFSKIENVMTTFSTFEKIFLNIELRAHINFSIFEKIFLNIESLMCALWTHISKIHKRFVIN